MSTIRLQHSIQKGDFCLKVDTRIPATGITGIFGESGSGKTTLLRCIAGLEGRQAGSLPVHQRRIGYVHQEPALFAHLSVQKNIEYGKRRNQGERSISDVAAEFGIGHLLQRSVATLSGGEAQRVSIVRALCQAPRLILMDEPLSALDERRRNDVLPFLEHLHAESSVPIIYVSHRIDEICRLSDHLLVLDKGVIVAEGELQASLARIDLPQLAGSNAGAVIEAKRCAYDAQFDLTSFEFSGGELLVAGRHEDEVARLRVSASDVSLSRDAPGSSSVLNILPAVIEATAAETRATVLVRLRLGEDLLVARITRRSETLLALAPGDEVFAQIKSVSVRR